MSDSKSLNPSLLVVMISSKNEHVFIHDLRDLTLQSIFDAWWASMNVGSNRPIAWNDSRHALLWRFYLHRGIKVTGSAGIICIVCNQVLCHPSTHWTTWMGKHLLGKVHISMLNILWESELTKWTGSMVNETSLAIHRGQVSRGITIVSSQWKFIFDIWIVFISTEVIDKMSKLAAKDIQTAEFHQDTSNRYCMIGFVLAHIWLSVISNHELRQS